jgi:hypothetical protein
MSLSLSLQGPKESLSGSFPLFLRQLPGSPSPIRTRRSGCKSHFSGKVIRTVPVKLQTLYWVIPSLMSVFMQFSFIFGRYIQALAK